VWFGPAQGGAGHDRGDQPQTSRQAHDPPEVREDEDDHDRRYRQHGHRHADDPEKTPTAERPPGSGRDGGKAGRAKREQDQAAESFEDQRHDQRRCRDEQGKASGPTPSGGDRRLARTAEGRLRLPVHHHPPECIHPEGSTPTDAAGPVVAGGRQRGCRLRLDHRKAPVHRRALALEPTARQQSGGPEARVEVRGSVGSGLRATQVITMLVKKSRPHTCCGLLSVTLIGAEMCLPSTQSGWQVLTVPVPVPIA
jgi:hypothetical protein